MPAASPALNKTVRAIEQVEHDRALWKAERLQFMSADELQRLTDAELIELQDHAHHVITSMETDDACYLDRHRVNRIRDLQCLRNMAYRELTRRAANALAAAE